MNRNKIAFIICLALGILGINLYLATPREAPDMVITRNSSTEQVPRSPKTLNTAIIKVQISGAVNNPGIYALDKGSRVEELVLLAGGMSSSADKDKANLAKLLKDGMLITIPNKKAEKQTVNNTVHNKISASSSVNINTADPKTLQTLQGVGPVLADRIVAWRQLNGRFSSKQELLKVSGISQKLFVNLENQITLD